jgi:hypothetical protein
LTLQMPGERALQTRLPDMPPGLDGEPFALRVEQIMHSVAEPATELQGSLDERNLR